jgi:hypothetical protein
LGRAPAPRRPPPPPPPPPACLATALRQGTLASAAVAVAAAALASTASAISPTSPGWWAGDSGIDFPYNDLTSFPLPSNDTRDCFDACLGNMECVGWVVAPAGCNGATATCWLKAAMPNATQQSCRLSGYVPSALGAKAFNPPPVGSVAPAGWLLREAWLQSQGLSGFLFYFWPDIQSSVWIGGGDDGGLHERGPYWLNGVVPLAYQLAAANNASSNLTAQVRARCPRALELQQAAQQHTSRVPCPARRR